MLFLGFMSCFCAASVVPFTWHYTLAPLSDCLWGLTVRSATARGYGHSFSLSPGVTAHHTQLLSFTFSADPGRTTVVEERVA